MRSGIKFLVFIGIITLAIFYQMVSFSAMVIATIVAFLVLAGLSVRFPVIRSFFGWIGFEIGANNNFRLYVLVGLAVVSFLFAFKFGAGEPLFLSTWRGTVDLAKPYNTPDRQKAVNRFAYGLNKETSSIDKEVAWLKAVGAYDGDIRPKNRQDETEIGYNQKIRNWAVYKLFVEDKVLDAWLKAMPTDFQVLKDGTAAKEKTWLFWKLFIMFSLLSLLYLPFAFADETAEMLKNVHDAFERKRNELLGRIAAPPTPTPAPAGAGAPATTPASASTTTASLGKFAWLYTSDMAAEFTMKLLQLLARNFATR